MSDSKMPDPPWRVLAATAFNKHAEPQWRMLLHGDTFRTVHGAQVYAGYLIIIDHPRNDPEAVALIRTAQEQQDAR